MRTVSAKRSYLCVKRFKFVFKRESKGSLCGPRTMNCVLSSSYDELIILYSLISLSKRVFNGLQQCRERHIPAESVAQTHRRSSQTFLMKLSSSFASFLASFEECQALAKRASLNFKLRKSLETFSESEVPGVKPEVLTVFHPGQPSSALLKFKI